LSSHEVNQPGSYRDVTDTTVVAQFKAMKKPTNCFRFWCCRYPGMDYDPLTLPSNTALTVGPKIDYVLVKNFNQYTFLPSNVVLAKT
jgi:isoleucyl-tRNA synthetase